MGARVVSKINRELLKEADAALREYVRRGNKSLVPAAEAVARELALCESLHELAAAMADAYDDGYGEFLS